MNIFRELKQEVSIFMQRVNQATCEEIGAYEKTPLDQESERLYVRCKEIEYLLTNLVIKLEEKIQPNPLVRDDDQILNKLGKSRERHSNLETFGLILKNAGRDFGKETAYSQSLLEIGILQENLGRMHEEFILKTNIRVIQPLRNFLDQEVRCVLETCRDLEIKRLDMDSKKNTLDKVCDSTEKKVMLAEIELAESEYKCFHKKFIIYGEKVVEMFPTKLDHIDEVIGLEFEYYTNCCQIMSSYSSKKSSSAKKSFEEHFKDVSCESNGSYGINSELSTKSSTMLI